MRRPRFLSIAFFLLAAAVPTATLQAEEASPFELFGGVPDPIPTQGAFTTLTLDFFPQATCVGEFLFGFVSAPGVNQGSVAVSARNVATGEVTALGHIPVFFGSSFLFLQALRSGTYDLTARGDGVISNAVRITVASVTVRGPSEMVVGETVTLTAQVEPPGGTLQFFLFGGGGGLADLDPTTGRLNAKGPGTIQVSAFYTVGGVFCGAPQPLSITIRTPLALKEATLAALRQAQADFPAETRRLQEVIDRIERSLFRLFITPTFLDPVHGGRVFDEERQAVQKAVELAGRRGTPVALRDILRTAIASLVRVDRALAQIALDEAEAFLGARSAGNRDLQEARDRLARGDRERDAGRFEKAIEAYGKAWERATRVGVPREAVAFVEDVRRLVRDANRALDPRGEDDDDGDDDESPEVRLRNLAQRVSRDATRSAETLQREIAKTARDQGISEAVARARVVEIIRRLGGSTLEGEIVALIARLEAAAAGTTPATQAAVAAAVQALRGLGLFADLTPPRITELLPSDGTRTSDNTPAIQASYTDDFSGVDAAGVRLSVDGIDVTSGAAVTASALTFTPSTPLSDGFHSIRVRVPDRAGNVAERTNSLRIDTTPPTIFSIAPPDGQISLDRTPFIQAQYFDSIAGVDIAGVRIFLDGEDVTAQATVQSFRVFFTPAQDLGDGVHTLRFVVPDLAGNVAEATSTFRIDGTPPSIFDFRPEEGTIVATRRPQIGASYADAVAGINRFSARLILDGIDRTFQSVRTDTGITFTPTFDLAEGEHAVEIRVSDLANNLATAGFPFTIDVTPPAITFLDPARDGFVNTRNPILRVGYDDVRSDVNLGTVEFVLNGIDLSDFVQVGERESLLSLLDGLGLPEGPAVLFVRVADAVGNESTATSVFTVDTIPPTLVLTQPVSGSFTSLNPLPAFGRSVDASPTTIRVEGGDGVSEGHGNLALGTFDVAVQLTPNARQTLLFQAIDAAGNRSPVAVAANITHDDIPPAAPALLAFDVLTDEPSFSVSGFAEPGVRVFLEGAPTTSGGNQVRASGRNGLFTIPVLLNPNATHAISVRSVDEAGNESPLSQMTVTHRTVLTFTERGRVLGLHNGSLQRGFVDETFVIPLTTFVSDARGGPVAGQSVTYMVCTGDGTFANGQREITVGTGADGMARAPYTAGPEAQEHILMAFFPANAGSNKVFQLESVARRPGEPTRVVGTVVGPQNQGIPGVTMRIIGTALATTTDALGNFELVGVPGGLRSLLIDGATATSGGLFANLLYEIIVLEGHDNTIPGRRTIRLPAIDPASVRTVTRTQGALLRTQQGAAFVQVAVPADPGGFRPGADSEDFSLAMVGLNQVPMPLPRGLGTGFIFALQPGGRHFDVPIPVTISNVDNLPPGSKALLFSFDHDVGEFVEVGNGTVSPDGRFIQSDPGVGIRVSAWHGFLSPVPEPTGCLQATLKVEEPGVCPVNVEAYGPNFTTDLMAGRNGEVTICNVPAGRSTRVEVVADSVEIGLTELDFALVVDNISEADTGDLAMLTVSVSDGLGSRPVSLVARLESKGAGAARFVGPDEGSGTLVDLGRSQVLSLSPGESRTLLINGETPSSTPDDVAVVVTANGIVCAREDLTVVAVQLIEATTGRKVGWLVDSQASPVISINPIRVSDMVSLRGEIATFRVSGTVQDRFADIVSDGSADVASIFIADQEISVQRDEREPPTEDRPFAYKGRFETMVSLPVISDRSIIPIETSPNVIGQAGRASIEILSSIVEERFSDQLFLSHPFSVRTDDPFSPDAIDTLFLLLETTSQAELAGGLDPSTPDTMLLRFEGSDVLLQESGNDTLSFCGQDPALGDMTVVVSGLQVLASGSIDHGAFLISAEQLFAGASLRFDGIELLPGGRVFQLRRELALSEVQGKPNSNLFAGTFPDFSSAEVRVRFVSGLDPAVLDEMEAVVSLPDLRDGPVSFSMQEEGAASGEFLVLLDGGGDTGEEPRRDRVVQTVLIEDGVGRGVFRPYRIRIHDARGLTSRAVSLGGSSFPVESDPESPGAFITLEPFVAIGVPPALLDPHLVVGGGSELAWAYNPTGQFKEWQLTVRTNTDVPVSDDNTLFSGPFYLWGTDFRFNGGEPAREGAPDSEGVVSIVLPEGVVSLKIEVWPVLREEREVARDGSGNPTRDLENKVFEQVFTEASQLTPGPHRFWDGRCNQGTDAGPAGDGIDGQSNVRGNDRKFLDPGSGEFVVKVTVMRRGGIEEDASIEIAARRKRLFVFDGEDRISNPARAVPNPYPSGELAYDLAGLLKPFIDGVEGHGNPDEIRTSRFDIQIDPNSDVVVFDYTDGVTFRDVYIRMTARGELASIGHGARLDRNGLFLDGGDSFFPGFVINNDLSAPIASGDPYPLPYLAVHRTCIDLKHCFTALPTDDSGDTAAPNSMIGRLLNVVTNGGTGAGGGKVIGYSDCHAIAFSPRVFHRARVRTDDEYFSRFAALYTAVNAAAQPAIGDPNPALREILRASAFSRVIEAGQVTIVVYSNEGAEVAGGPHAATLLNRNFGEPPAAPVQDEFTYVAHVRRAVEIEGGLRNASVFTGVAGLGAHAIPTPIRVGCEDRPGHFVIRFEGRGNVFYQTRFMLHTLPIETRADGGRLERFRRDVLRNIALPGGRNADEVFQYDFAFSSDVSDFEDTPYPGMRLDLESQE